MTRRQKDPLRPLTEAERVALEQLSRAAGEPASLSWPKSSCALHPRA